nr:hypothetical protein [Mycoplana azooxidifex]
MIRAILAGTKTQTRRIIKPQPDGISEGQIPSQLRIAVGDRLWVREAWHAARSLNSTRPRDIPTDADIEHAATARSYADIGLKGKLRPGMFMPRWASRLTLIVTDVRVERLQDISEADARAEGIVKVGRFYGLEDADWDCASTESAVDAYAALWETINGDGSWQANPWVAAYTFTVQLQSIDEAAAR